MISYLQHSAFCRTLQVLQKCTIHANERNQFKWPVIGVCSVAAKMVPALNLFPVVAAASWSPWCAAEWLMQQPLALRDHLDGQLNS
jgi:hypothetical protein